MAEEKKVMNVQPGDTILMLVKKMSLGADGKTYVTLGNADVFSNDATVILRK